MVDLLTWLVSNWLAGEDRVSGVRAAAEANRRGVGGIINYLGEHTGLSDVELIVEEYLALLALMAKKKVDSSVSVKPTQIGLDAGATVFQRNLEMIVEEAERLGIFVWVDMESYKYLDDTLDVYHRVIDRFGNVGVAIQAYLHRSEGDIRRLLSSGGRIRICKGAYRESAEVALRKSADIVENFSRLLRILFEEGDNFAIATHDKVLIGEALSLSRRYRRDFEVQMLKGVRDDLKNMLIQKGHRISEYIPYGENWLPYVLRRFRERKSSVLLILKSIIQR